MNKNRTFIICIDCMQYSQNDFPVIAEITVPGAACDECGAIGNGFNLAAIDTVSIFDSVGILNHFLATIVLNGDIPKTIPGYMDFTACKQYHDLCRRETFIRYNQEENEFYLT